MNPKYKRAFFVANVPLLLVLVVVGVASVGCVTHSHGATESADVDEVGIGREESGKGKNSEYAGTDGEKTKRSLARDGEACAKDSDCVSGNCLTKGDWGKFGGACTPVSCASSADCNVGASDEKRGQGGEAVCRIEVNGTSYCLKKCSVNEDCRRGFVCQKGGGTVGGCVLNKDLSYNYQFKGNVVVKSGQSGVAKLDFDVPQNAKGYAIEISAKDGSPLNAVKIINSEGTSELLGEPSPRYMELVNKGNKLAKKMGLPSVVSIVIPIAPKYADFVKPGKVTVEVRTETSGEDVYGKFFAVSKEGTRLDVNVYLVGVRDPGDPEKELSEEDAAKDPKLKKMLAYFGKIYKEKFGITIGKVRYIALAKPIVDRYENIRVNSFDSFMEQTGKLFSHSVSPGTTVEENLSVNLFLVRTVTIATYRKLVGLSGSMPGPVGVHGTPQSGMIFSTERLYGEKIYDALSFEGANRGVDVDAQEYYGVVLAHEMGHYLGLFHTSESGSYLKDELPDTAECDQQIVKTKPWECGDINNLMFPYAGFPHKEVSEQQKKYVALNPLVK